MHKQEVLDVLEVYHRNMLHILGDKDEQVGVIKTCINLVDELEDDSSYWEDIEVNDTDPIEMWQTAKCHKCGLYITTPYMYSVRLHAFCPHCGVGMRSKSKNSYTTEIK